MGKALGGGLGCFTTGHKEIIDILRQRSRPYLFSNSLSPANFGASLAVFDLNEKNTHFRDKLMDNAAYFKSQISESGFELKPSDSAIVSLMLHDAALSQKFAARLLEKGFM